VHNELPPEAKSPHEALVDARKESRRFAGELSALKEENEKLKARIFDAETKYRELQSASTDEEKVTSLTDQVARLTAQLVEAQKRADEAEAALNKVKADSGKSKSGEKSAK
jgi:predicted RNase H-like nuclease (RuvC/YqgF family)